MVSLAGTPRSVPHWQPTIGILPNGAVGVQSERYPGRYWTVRSTPTGGTCTCPDWQFRFPERFDTSSTVGFAFGAAMVGAIMGSIQGAVAGVIQWLVLRRSLSGVGWWMVATMVGFAVVHAVGDAAAVPIGGAVSSGAIFGVVAGAVVGLLQWLVLRRRVA